MTHKVRLIWFNSIVPVFTPEWLAPSLATAPAGDKLEAAYFSAAGVAFKKWAALYFRLKA